MPPVDTSIKPFWGTLILEIPLFLSLKMLLENT